jgi:hypothetical protein
MLTHPLIENEVFMEPIEDIGSANWSSTKVIPSQKNAESFNEKIYLDKMDMKHCTYLLQISNECKLM